ncbi:protein kinase [Nocardioides sp. KC13]|uniref:Protein kinase n=1 Tax=Nocardioides turkmenicus TaxID=2711220 RepID=A0A6M1R3K4_9ACTN|nr:protein kinase [Nocardioides sp. KC13]NGN92258.1 protein kinase [Nocardioides sp. KC13]
MSREIPTSPQSAATQASPVNPVSPLTANDPREIGPYRLTGRLGHGGMGVVYLGEDAAGMKAAVKAILPELTSDPGFRARFEREIEAAKRVESRFTARVLDADPDAEQPWMASEYVADPPLNKLIGSGRRLTEIDVRQLVAGVAEALAAVHAAGLVHRDIKPGNILYGDTDPCVIDMGIARSVDGTALTQTGKAVGTYGYQAPEQVQTGTFSSAVDIWALGLVAFVAATGRWPFSGEIGSMGHLLKGESPNLSLCPVYLRPLVAACLADEPTARPSAADILATNGDWTLLPAPITSEAETTVGALPPSLTGTGITRAPRPAASLAGPGNTADLPTHAPTFAEPTQPPGRRWKVAVMAAAAVVLVSAGVAVAANPDLLPGQDDEPRVSEVTPSAEPSTGERSTAPSTPVGGTVDTGTDPEFDEEPADERPEDDGEIVPSEGAASGDATPSESPEPTETVPSDPASETVTETPTAEPTETATAEPTEDPVEEPTATASP